MIPVGCAGVGAGVGANGKERICDLDESGAPKGRTKFGASRSSPHMPLIPIPVHTPITRNDIPKPESPTKGTIVLAT